MQIVLVLVFLGAIVGVTLMGMMLASFITGFVLTRHQRTKPLALVFLLIVPGAGLGALAGAIGIGYVAIHSDGNLIVLGPVVGAFGGGLVGLFAGTSVALTWWYRTRNAQPVARPNDVSATASSS